MDIKIFDTLKAQAEAGNAELRRDIDAIESNLNGAKLALNDRLEDLQRRQAELSRDRAEAFEVFNAAVTEELTSLTSVRLKLGGKSKIQALPGKGKEAA